MIARIRRAATETLRMHNVICQDSGRAALFDS
jgi:hypothetical protein